MVVNYILGALKIRAGSGSELFKLIINFIEIKLYINLIDIYIIINLIIYNIYFYYIINQANQDLSFQTEIHNIERDEVITAGSGPKMATGGIIPSGYSNDTFQARLSSGEAVIPLDNFYAKLDELINVVKQGGNVYLDSNKVGTAMGMSSFKSS